MMETDISKAMVTLDEDAFRYDGTEHFPTVTVTGAGDYEGEATAYFAIRSVIGDTDGDGLDIIDATYIQRFLVGMDVPYPVDAMMT